MPSIYNPTTGTITGASESKWFVPEDRLNPDQISETTTCITSGSKVLRGQVNQFCWFM